MVFSDRMCSTFCKTFVMLKPVMQSIVSMNIEIQESHSEVVDNWLGTHTEVLS